MCHHLMDPAQTQRIHELFRLEEMNNEQAVAVDESMADVESKAEIVDGEPESYNELEENNR